MSHVKKFGFFFGGVILSLVVLSFIPAGLKSKIPGLTNVQ